MTTDTPRTDKEMESLHERLLDEADLCRNEGATDIAKLLDEASQEIGVLSSELAASEANGSAMSANQCCVKDGLLGDEYGNQYCAVLKRAEAAEARIKEMTEIGVEVANERLEQVEAELAECKRDVERYRAIKWSELFHLDADESGPAAEKFDSFVDEIVTNYRVLRTDAARKE
jgi:hypothetical protein